MTKIKLCGLSRPLDVKAANELKPDYIGFVFAKKSKRYINPEQAGLLRNILHPAIQAVGVFVNENPAIIAELLNNDIIQLAQLHGSEKENDMQQLRAMTHKPIIQAFSMDTELDVDAANASSADYIMLDSGSGGTGTVFDWELIKTIHRPYFLAGGLSPDNISSAIRALKPYAVDVSSGIETEGSKDRMKMAAFVSAVRKEERK